MKKRIIIVIVTLVLLFVADRYLWMTDRAKKTWVNQSGRNLGDPIAYNQDFDIKDSEIIFKNNKTEDEYPFVFRNRQSKFYLLGCYFGTLYIRDLNRKETIVYSDY